MNWVRGVEWPTVALLITVYLCFILCSFYSVHITLFLSIPIMAMVVALHSSLQHEVLHGHPFQNQFLSELTVFPAIGLFIPYLRFKETHLKHHYDPNLTDPYDDPETNYFDVVIFEKKRITYQQLLWFNNTLAGRMLIGPFVALLLFYKSEAREFFSGNKLVILAWWAHILGLIPVLYWIASYATMPIWAFLFSVYCGHSLLKVRTYLEHRADERASARTVVIEDRGIFALLFLNNNFHAVHHAYPKIAWYELPAFYHSKRETFLERNSGYSYANYWQVFRRYFFRAKDGVVHPIWSITNRTK